MIKRGLEALIGIDQVLLVIRRGNSRAGYQLSLPHGSEADARYAHRLSVATDSALSNWRSHLWRDAPRASMKTGDEKQWFHLHLVPRHRAPQCKYEQHKMASN